MFRVLSSARGTMLVALSSLMLLGSGCNSSVIDHVSFQISPNDQDISVALVFANTIQSTLSGTFPIKNYGDIFVQPWTSTQPFELGFNLNTAIVNDNDYIHLTPTSYLPNGVPLGIPYPLVEIQGATPISSSFNLAGYVDIEQQAWFGAAATFSFINSTDFPPGMAITGAFAQNSAGNPGILAYVYGAALNSDGTLKQPGGIAVLGNIKQLAGLSAMHGGGIVDLKPDKVVQIAGPHADTAAMMELQRKFIEGLNQAR